MSSEFTEILGNDELLNLILLKIESYFMGLCGTIFSTELTLTLLFLSSNVGI